MFTVSCWPRQQGGRSPSPRRRATLHIPPAPTLGGARAPDCPASTGAASCAQRARRRASSRLTPPTRAPRRRSRTSTPSCDWLPRRWTNAAQTAPIACGQSGEAWRAVVFEHRVLCTAASGRWVECGHAIKRGLIYFVYEESNHNPLFPPSIPPSGC